MYIFGGLTSISVSWLSTPPCKLLWYTFYGILWMYALGLIQCHVAMVQCLVAFRKATKHQTLHLAVNTSMQTLVVHSFRDVCSRPDSVSCGHGAVFGGLQEGEHVYIISKCRRKFHA